MQQEWTAARGKSNAELYTELEKSTWKAFEKIIRRDQNRSVKA